MSFSWLPIMKAYESGTAAYFATPPTNLVYAVHAAMTAITKQCPPLNERLKMHMAASAKVRQACTDLGLKLVICQSSYVTV
jgi:alanine-glyoxylate transaminase / serine-glyoxylate transaminase / serine-pyruvate transaminase